MMSDLLRMMWTAQVLYSLLTVWAAVMRNDYTVPLIGSSITGGLVLFVLGSNDGVFALWSLGMLLAFAIVKVFEGWNE